MKFSRVSPFPPVVAVIAAAVLSIAAVRPSGAAAEELPGKVPASPEVVQPVESPDGNAGADQSAPVEQSPGEASLPEPVVGAETGHDPVGQADAPIPAGSGLESAPADGDAAADRPGPAVVVGEEPEKKSEENVLDKLVKSKRVKFEGSYQLHYTYMPTWALDETGANDGLKQYLDHRLNLRPLLILTKDVELLIDVDLIAGQLAGSTTTAASDILLQPRSSNDWTGRAMLRELKLSWKSIAGELYVGQVAPTWGLGLVFNGGRPTERDFNDNWTADLIERLAFDAKPFAAAFPGSAAARAFHVLVAGDVVFLDEFADLMNEDHAYGFSGAVYFDHNPEDAMWRTFSGIFVNYRWQEYADAAERLELTTTDVFSEHEFRLKSGDSVKLAVEAAMSAGHSTKMVTNRARDGVDILGWGLAARAQYTYRKGVEASLEFGAASGDPDSGDSSSYGFAFDPSYQVGMILFPDVLGRSTAWSASRAAAPGMGWAAPGGYELSVTNGSVTNAMYLHPQFRFTPVKGLDARLGFLWAKAFNPVASYYNSLVAGGYPKSFRNGPASTDLGVELDAAVYYTTPPIWKTLAVRLGLAGGWCRPGEAFADESGNGPGNLFKVRVGLDIVF